MKNVYLSIAIIAMVLAMNMIVSASDPRVAYAVPYLAPDPSLVTTDPFYGDMGAQYIGPVATDGYQLPAIFSDPNFNTVELDIDNHAAKMDSETKHITAKSSYELTEDQLTRGNVTLGSESWL